MALNNFKCDRMMPLCFIGLTDLRVDGGTSRWISHDRNVDHCHVACDWPHGGIKFYVPGNQVAPAVSS